MSQRSFMQIHPCATWARGMVGMAGKYYERAVAAAAATFLAALAAFAAVDALRRLLVFGGVAGASPMSSAVIMLVTNSLGPWSSKSTEVRSWSDAVTIPRPYTPCLIVCPSCIACTTSSWSRTRRGINFFGGRPGWEVEAPQFTG